VFGWRSFQSYVFATGSFFVKNIYFSFHRLQFKSLAVLQLLSGKLVKGGSARLCRKVEKILLPTWGTLGAFCFFW
jgi:hypothetical protein